MLLHCSQMSAHGATVSFLGARLPKGARRCSCHLGGNSLDCGETRTLVKNLPSSTYLRSTACQELPTGGRQETRRNRTVDTRCISTRPENRHRDPGVRVSCHP